jgi:segregation and condensation protein B
MTETEIPESSPESGEAEMSAALTRAQALRVLEAVLFAAAEPLDRASIARHMPDGVELDTLIEDLERQYSGRGVNLVQVAGRYALRTAPDLAHALRIERSLPRKLSKAATETLAIIAYHQPVTRPEIEDIRGVALSKGTLETLMDAGWIEPRGHRETPGRPALWCVTAGFLDHFGLNSRDDLPGLDDLRSAGLLDPRPAISTYGASAGESEPAAAEADEPADDEAADPGDAAIDDETREIRSA